MVYIWPNEMDYYNCICFSWYILHRFLFHNFNKNKTIKILYNYMSNWPSVTIITLLCWLVTYPKSGQLTTCWIDPENNFHIITTVCFCTTEIRCTFWSNHNIHKSSCCLCFWAPDPLIDRVYKNLWRYEKQRPHELIGMLWFNKKYIECS